MKNIICFEDLHGDCPISSLLISLNAEAKTNKYKKGELKRIVNHVDVLQELGTMAGEQYVKYLRDGIWELRPGKNRILFFLGEHNEIILLHSFRKTSSKTPKREIEKAKKERDYWIKNYEDNQGD